MDEYLHYHLQNIELTAASGNFKLAIDDLEALSNDYPGSYHVTSMLGELYLYTGKPNKAIKPLLWAIKNPPRVKFRKIGRDNENLFISQLKKNFAEKNYDFLWVDQFLLGCAYGRCTRFQRAIYHLKIADRLNPNNTEIIRNLGWVRCMQDKKYLGRSLLKKAIDLDPHNALAYNDLGASYLFEEDLKEADHWIQKAIELDPFDKFIANTAEKLEELRVLQRLFKK